MKKKPFWKARSSTGAKKIFDSPEILWKSACEYFQWCEDNPLREEKVFHTAGIITRANVAKMRAMTETGMCIFLGISSQTFRDYSQNKDERYKSYIEVTRKIKEIIYNQKFSGAAAEMLNANIIARDLGLRDYQELDVSDNRKTKLQEQNRVADDLADQAEKRINAKVIDFQKEIAK